jgi:cyclic-di-GMP phosphodiesterase TipF (flagellum assembly factor)
MSYNSDLSDTLVFEFAKETIEQCGPVEAENLAKLASLNFKFSLDRVGDLDLDLPDLRQRNFRYVKVSSSLFLRGVRPGNDAAVNPADMRQLLGRFGIDLIIERVENEGQVLEALEFDVSYAQGFLFGRPRPLEEVEASIGALADREEEDRQEWQPLEYHPSSDQDTPGQASGF